MSKTFEDQALKAKTLAECMKRNFNELSAKDVKQETLDKLIKASEEAIIKSLEVDKLRMVVSEKLKDANAALSDVKDMYNELRRIIKTNFPIEQWHIFGLMDKR